MLTLLQDAGHTDFRDARGPMGFTQRQAAGKFTRTKRRRSSPSSRRPSRRARPACPRTPTEVSASEQVLRRMPAEQLAAELQRRGWVVVQP